MQTVTQTAAHLFIVHFVTLSTMVSLNLSQHCKSAKKYKKTKQKQPQNLGWVSLAPCPQYTKKREEVWHFSRSASVFLSKEETSNPVFTRGGVTARQSESQHQTFNTVQTESLSVLSAESSVMFTVWPPLRDYSNSIGSVVSIQYVPLQNKLIAIHSKCHKDHNTVNPIDPTVRPAKERNVWTRSDPKFSLKRAL